MNPGIFISAIILAAGQSKRMGMPKLLMPLEHGTILEQTVDNFLNSRVNETIVVLGYKADELMQKLVGKQVKTVINPVYKQGMSTSIIAGMESIHAQTNGIMIGLADEPFIDSQTINRLIDEYSNHKKGIAIPSYRGIRGRPAIYNIKYKDELAKIKGDIGCRLIVSHHPDDILEVQVDCKGINHDIDTMADYRLYGRGSWV
ncbi:NTP transferase domain-containing protein [Chloroflexota bacterium]